MEKAKDYKIGDKIPFGGISPIQLVKTRVQDGYKYHKRNKKRK